MDGERNREREKRERKSESESEEEEENRTDALARESPTVTLGYLECE